MKITVTKEEGHFEPITLGVFDSEKVDQKSDEFRKSGLSADEFIRMKAKSYADEYRGAAGRPPAYRVVVSEENSPVKK